MPLNGLELFGLFLIGISIVGFLYGAWRPKRK